MNENSIPFEKLKELGVDPEKLRPEDYFKLLNNQKTDVINLRLDYTPERENLLKSEKINYQILEDNGKQILSFEGRIQMEPQYTAKNTPENIDLLKKANLQYETAPDNSVLRVRDTLALTAALLNPEIGAILAIYYAMKVIPQRMEVKNEMGLSHSEISDLKSGKTIQHRMGSELMIMQLDPKTNGISSVKQSDIQIPDEILGKQLSQNEKSRLKSGFEVTLDNGVSLKLDLGKAGGLKYTDSKGKELTYKEAMEYRNEEKETRKTGIRL